VDTAEQSSFCEFTVIGIILEKYCQLLENLYAVGTSDTMSLLPEVSLNKNSKPNRLAINFPRLSLLLVKGLKTFHN
jgi:hypothetical protein